MFSTYFVFGILLLLLNSVQGDDQPCASRDVGIEGRSIVCVCNSTYCDSVAREAPSAGSYVIYTSSKSGKRFEKVNGVIQTYTNLIEAQTEECDITDLANADDDEDSGRDGSDQSCSETFWNTVSLGLQVDTREQYVEGFGGSITDATAYNWNKLSEETRTHLLKTYFSEEGLGYNMIRIPIGGSDFSSRPYTYNDYPLDDETLSNFTLAEEDIKLKIPMIKAIQKISKKEIKIIASTWSPPVWMKSNEKFFGYSQLKLQYYQSFADYHIRMFGDCSRKRRRVIVLMTRLR